MKVLFPKSGAYPISPQDLSDEVSLTSYCELDTYLSTIACFAKSVNSFSFRENEFYAYTETLAHSCMLTPSNCAGYQVKLAKRVQCFVVVDNGRISLTHEFIAKAAMKGLIIVELRHIVIHRRVVSQIERYSPARFDEIKEMVRTAQKTGFIGPFEPEKYLLAKQLKHFVETRPAGLYITPMLLLELFVDFPHDDCVEIVEL